MTTIPLKFNKGIQPTAQIGTLQLKPTAEGLLAYAQNIDASNDEYGMGVLLPGPSLTTITNNSQLTGVPIAKAHYTSNATINYQALFLAEGVLGNTNRIRTVTGVQAGGTPQLTTDGGSNKTVTHNDASGNDTTHTGIIVDDIEAFVTSAGSTQLLVLGKDATDIWLQKATISSGTTNILGTLIQVATFTSRLSAEHRMIAGDDGKIYVTRYGYPNALASVSSDLTTVVASAYTLPQNKTMTALGKYRTYMAIGYCSNEPGDFSERKAGGSSGIILWNYVDTNTFEIDVPCPSHYISAIFNDPAGNTFCFGGLDQGKTTLYNFTGYGFNALISYVGEMPRNRHSITFDAQGRILWQTADGQFLRYSPVAGTLEHLGTIATTAGHGGVFCKLLGGTGNDFLMGSGVDTVSDTFTLKRVIFGSYIGDSGSDGVTTPIAVCGLTAVPPRSMLEYVDVNLQKNLASGDKLEVRLYKDGSTTPATLGTLDFSVDGAIAAKRIYLRKYGLDNMSIGFAWKMTDASTTAPGIVSASLTYKPLR